MPNMFNDFDLDVHKVAEDYDDTNGESRSVIWTTIKSIALSCTGCIEAGRTSDLCNSDNCSALTHCDDCF